MPYYNCPYCGDEGKPIYWRIPLWEHLLYKCENSPYKEEFCEDCSDYYPLKLIEEHKKQCKWSNNFDHCAFCRMTLVKKYILEHQDNCPKNPKNVHFNPQVAEPKFEKVMIKHKPLPPERINKGRCSICEKNFPMAQSNICYECKDK